jgi:hypothetical protein
VAHFKASVNNGPTAGFRAASRPEVPIYFYAGAYYALIYSDARIIYVYLCPCNAAWTGC